MAILVAFDGSHPAQKAVERAVSNHADEELILLRVIEASSGMLHAGIDLVQEKLKEEWDEAEVEISEDIKNLLDTENVDFRLETVFGEPSREIVSFAEEHDIETIFIGSHGREGVSRVLLGNVAENVVRRAPVTVTVVR